MFEHEIPQFKAAFASISQGYDPKFCMIVVKKRISTRLFAEQQGQYANPMPGTVVDTVVTRPEWFDFFLVSQSVRQGTVTPTHYNIIADTIGWKPEILQRLTYKLCHLYYNWPVSQLESQSLLFSELLFFIGSRNTRVPPQPLPHCSECEICSKLTEDTRTRSMASSWCLFW